MSEEPGTGRRELDDSTGQHADGTPARDETYYSLGHDNMLRVNRRQEKRSQTYWVAASQLEPRFADHVQLTRVDRHYHLTFGQSRVPIAREASEPTAVSEIQPVARLILPEEVTIRLATALQQELPGE